MEHILTAEVYHQDSGSKMFQLKDAEGFKDVFCEDSHQL
jgi:hypothetical protein